MSAEQVLTEQIVTGEAVQPVSATAPEASLPVMRNDAPPTVADFIAPLGSGSGKVSLDAKALELSFTRSGGDINFSVKAESVTMSGERR